MPLLSQLNNKYIPSFNNYHIQPSHYQVFPTSSPSPPVTDADQGWITDSSLTESAVSGNITTTHEPPIESISSEVDRTTTSADNLYGTSEPQKAITLPGRFSFDYKSNAPDSTQSSEPSNEVEGEPLDQKGSSVLDKTNAPFGCFIASGGFMCCDTVLENVMVNAYNELSRKANFSHCNTDRISMVIQNAVQRKFGRSFETIIALKDFVSLSSYEGNLRCKFVKDGKYFYSYATPVQQYELNDLR